VTTVDDVCIHCNLEALHDGGDDALCPLCDGDRTFANAHEFEAAVRSWAARESGHILDDHALREFVSATFVHGDLASLYAAYAVRAKLERLCDPFDRAQGGAATIAPRSERVPPTDRERLPMVPLVTPDYPSPPASFQGVAQSRNLRANDPHLALRAVIYPLASVAASDGTTELAERWFIDQCLKRFGLGPATDAEIRIYHPLDYAVLVPEDVREGLLLDMCRLAMIDGLPDAAEARMIYAYCSEWRIPEEQARARLLEMQNKNISLARQFWLGFRNYVLPGRWENTKL
jgi:hypothetical protein